MPITAIFMKWHNEDQQQRRPISAQDLQVHRGDRHPSYSPPLLTRILRILWCLRFISLAKGQPKNDEFVSPNGCSSRNGSVNGSEGEDCQQSRFDIDSQSATLCSYAFPSTPVSTTKNAVQSIASSTALQMSPQKGFWICYTAGQQFYLLKSSTVCELTSTKHTDNIVREPNPHNFKISH
ncbi:hypothetical protein V9T40_001493 [Parthenolecanium corni]|uniref:Uncharacterized protein n=1 Tax=Parthenolecanium corni TaxID=536013 RepID=A0AAN9TI34_9HEMI